MGTHFKDLSPGYLGVNRYECTIVCEAENDPGFYWVIVQEGPEKGKRYMVAWTMLRTSR